MAQTEVGVSESEDPVLLCIISFETCEFGRRGTGLPPSPLIQIRPAEGATAGFDSDVLIAVDPIDLAAGTQLDIQGCLAAATPDGSGAVELDMGGNAVLQIPRYGEQLTCDSTIRATFSNGETAVVTRSYVRPEGDVEPNNITVTVIPTVQDARGIPYPIVLRSIISCDVTPVGIGDADDLILTGHLPSPTSDGRNRPNEPLEPWAQMQGQSTVLSDAECSVSLTADSEGVTIERYRLFSESEPGTVARMGDGGEMTLDVARLSPARDSMTVYFDVAVDDDAPIDVSWPAPAQDVVSVTLVDEFSRLECDSIDQYGPTTVQRSVASSEKCKVLQFTNAYDSLTMQLGAPLQLSDNRELEFSRDGGPVAVWGGIPDFAPPTP